MSDLIWLSGGADAPDLSRIFHCRMGFLGSMTGASSAASSL